jgi:putative phosphoribosyl transferase
VKLFSKRVEAGRRLAAALSGVVDSNAIVLAIPRGGVAVGFEVANSLAIPLDIIVPRKIGAPNNPELAVGAVTEEGIIILDDRIIGYLQVTREYIREESERQRQEIRRRLRLYRGDIPYPNLKNREVIIVDDGIATGYTMKAALASVRRKGARKVVVGVPVGPSDTIKDLKKEADSVFCLHTPEHFYAIGQFYEDFAQISDEDVVRLLEIGRRAAIDHEGSMKHAAEEDKSGEELVRIPAGTGNIEGSMVMPSKVEGIVVFAHGSGSSRFSPRNQYVAKILNEAGIATLLIDLLTKEEEEIDMQTRKLRFDTELLAERLIGATEWIKKNPSTKRLSLGYFGASTGAAAALIAAVKIQPEHVQAIVSRGGRPDLAMKYLPKIEAPILFIVGELDDIVIDLNKEAMKHLRSEKRLEIVPGASHLFEEPGKLEQVARLATAWFMKHFSKS